MTCIVPAYCKLLKYKSVCKKQINVHYLTTKIYSLLNFSNYISVLYSLQEHIHTPTHNFNFHLLIKAHFPRF